MTKLLASTRSKPLIGARPQCAPSQRPFKTPGESFEQFKNSRTIAPKHLPPPMPQNHHTDCKIRLVLEHTPAGRAVFYCVTRDTTGAKSANFAIKNRVAPNAPKFERPVFVDIEPPANVPYINGLAEH